MAVRVRSAPGHAVVDPKRRIAPIWRSSGVLAQPAALASIPLHDIPARIPGPTHGCIARQQVREGPAGLGHYRSLAWPNPSHASPAADSAHPWQAVAAGVV